MIIPALESDCDFALPVLFASLLATMLRISPNSATPINGNTKPTMLSGE